MMKCFTDPAKLRLILGVQKLGLATTKMLQERNPDIAQATLYRHLKSMTEIGILRIASEKKVRNVTEKTYELAIDLDHLAKDTIANNDALGYYLLFQQFVAGLSKEFQDYSKREEIDLIKDATGFRALPFYATAEETLEMLKRIARIVAEYEQNEPTPERQLRTFARIITPPKEKVKGDKIGEH